MHLSLELLNQLLAQLPEQRPVSRQSIAPEMAEQLDLSLGAQGCDSQQLLPFLRDYLLLQPDVASRDFYKLLYSGQNQAALLGDWVSAIGNANMHTFQMSPVATLMELELIKQLNSLIGFDSGEGVMVSGGSQANIISMMLARHRACPEAKTSGFDGRNWVALVSDQAHYSAQKGANLLGIGSENLVAVASDEAGRMDPASLKATIEQCLAAGKKPFYLGLTAGTTVVGAYDPVAECAQIAKQYDLWLHIDGAWGAPVLFSEQHRQLLAGSEFADSFTWDAHKLMNVPITAAFILTRESGLLEDCCSGGGGEYLFHADQNAPYNLGQRSIQCGRRADALKVWSSWKQAGSAGFAAKIDQLMALKQQLVEKIEASANFELLAPAAYCNVLFRYRAPQLDEQAQRQLTVDICKTLMARGIAYSDYAKFKGRTGIRLILANDSADLAQLEQLLATIESVAQELLDQ